MTLFAPKRAKVVSTMTGGVKVLADVFLGVACSALYSDPWTGGRAASGGGQWQHIQHKYNTLGNLRINILGKLQNTKLSHKLHF